MASADLHLCRQEFGFFSTRFENGWDWYVANFDPSPEHKAVGEISHSYLVSPEAPAQIRAHLPNVKMIACLRDPVQRTFSDYLDRVKNGKMDGTFEEELERDPALINRSRYGTQLARYLELFDRAQFHIVSFDELVATPADFTAGMFEFLGVDVLPLPDKLQRKVLPAGTPRSATVAKGAKALSALARRTGLNWLRGKVKPYAGDQEPPLSPVRRQASDDARGYGSSPASAVHRRSRASRPCGWNIIRRALGLFSGPHGGRVARTHAIRTANLPAADRAAAWRIARAGRSGTRAGRTPLPRAGDRRQRGAFAGHPREKQAEQTDVDRSGEKLRAKHVPRSAVSILQRLEREAGKVDRTRDGEQDQEPFGGNPNCGPASRRRISVPPTSVTSTTRAQDLSRPASLEASRCEAVDDCLRQPVAKAPDRWPGWPAGAASAFPWLYGSRGETRPLAPGRRTTPTASVPNWVQNMLTELEMLVWSINGQCVHSLPRRASGRAARTEAGIGDSDGRDPLDRGLRDVRDCPDDEECDDVRRRKPGDERTAEPHQRPDCFAISDEVEAIEQPEHSGGRRAGGQQQHRGKGCGQSLFLMRPVQERADERYPEDSDDRPGNGASEIERGREPEQAAEPIAPVVLRVQGAVTDHALPGLELDEVRDQLRIGKDQREDAE